MAELSREDMMRAISTGIAEGVGEWLTNGCLTASGIQEAIASGVKEAFDQLWPSEIENALARGAREAVSHK